MLVATSIAMRLLLLSRRTREWPEFLIGAGLLLPAAVALPFMAASGLSSPSISGLNLPVLAIGLLGIAGSIAFLMAFTWRVFHPSSPAAAIFAIGTGLAALAVCGLFLHAMVSAPPTSSPRDIHGPYSFAVRLLFEIWYAWMGIESLLEWSRARRRLALGLSDPVVVNRFALWGAMGLALTFNGAVAMALESSGWDTMKDPLPAFWLALNGVVASALMFLTFVPPAGYLDWIRSRHASQLPA